MPEDRPDAGQLSEAFDRASAALNAAGARYALMGGFAVALHGLPRATRDVDFLISVPRLSLPGVLEKFRENGFVFDLLQVIHELGTDHISSIRAARSAGEPQERRLSWLEALRAGLRSSDPAACGEAAKEIARLAPGDAESLPLLIHALGDPGLRMAHGAICAALLTYDEGTEAAVPALVAVLRARDGVYAPEGAFHDLMATLAEPVLPAARSSPGPTGDSTSSFTTPRRAGFTSCEAA